MLAFSVNSLSTAIIICEESHEQRLISFLLSVNILRSNAVFSQFTKTFLSFEKPTNRPWKADKDDEINGEVEELLEEVVRDLRLLRLLHKLRLDKSKWGEIVHHYYWKEVDEVN